MGAATLLNAPLAAAQAAQPAPTTAPAQPQTEQSQANQSQANQSQAKQSLTRFLGALAGNPELFAAQAGLEAAELQLRAARDPVSLEATGGYSRFALDDALTGLNPAQITGPTDPGADPGAAPSADDLGTAISETGYKLGATLVFRPFPFGDTADLLTQRQVELQTSQLDLENARAGLEARALVAAPASATRRTLRQAFARGRHRGDSGLRGGPVTGTQRSRQPPRPPRRRSCAPLGADSFK